MTGQESGLREAGMSKFDDSGGYYSVRFSGIEFARFAPSPVWSEYAKSMEGVEDFSYTFVPTFVPTLAAHPGPIPAATLTEAERETLRDACNLSNRSELVMNVCAVVERILAARIEQARAGETDDGPYCSRCGRHRDWDGATSPGAPCMGCGRYPAARAGETALREAVWSITLALSALCGDLPDGAHADRLAALYQRLAAALDTTGGTP